MTWQRQMLTCCTCGSVARSTNRLCTKQLSSAHSGPLTALCLAQPSTGSGAVAGTKNATVRHVRSDHHISQKRWPFQATTTIVLLFEHAYVFRVLRANIGTPSCRMVDHHAFHGIPTNTLTLAVSDLWIQRAGQPVLGDGLLGAADGHADDAHRPHCAPPLCSLHTRC